MGSASQFIWNRVIAPRVRSQLGPWSDLRWPLTSHLRDAGQLAWEGAQALADRIPIPARSGFTARHAAYARADETDLWALGQAQARWVTRSGPLPHDGQPYLALTAHYGAGMWAHVVFARHHRRTRWLYSPWGQAPTAWEDRLSQRRLDVLQRHMGHPPLATGGAAQAMLEWWHGGGGIMALADAPPADRRKIELPLFSDWSLKVPAGLFVLAAQNTIPVYVYFCTLHSDGRRHVEIAPPLTSSDPEVLARHFANRLTLMLARDPAAWHFWPRLHAFR